MPTNATLLIDRGDLPTLASAFLIRSPEPLILWHEREPDVAAAHGAHAVAATNVTTSNNAPSAALPTASRFARPPKGCATIILLLSLFWLPSWQSLCAPEREFDVR